MFNNTAKKELVSFAEWQEQGFDLNSVVANPLFIDPAKGDYRVQPNSPALRLGFRNFPMDNFGVLKSEFRTEAKDGHQRFYEYQIQIP